MDSADTTRAPQLYLESCLIIFRVVRLNTDGEWVLWETGSAAVMTAGNFLADLLSLTANSQKASAQRALLLLLSEA